MDALVGEHGLDPAAVDKLEQTPLFYAAREGDAEACTYLIDHRCDPDHTDTILQTPLYYAATGKHLDCVKLLLERRGRADRIDKSMHSPLFYASDVPCADALLDAACDPNHRDIMGQTAIFPAAGSGAADKVQLLTSHGADVHVTDLSGWTCLFHAAKGGHNAVCQLLVHDKGADPCWRDHSGHKAYAVAEAWKHRSLATVLEGMEKRARSRGAALQAPAKRHAEGLKEELYNAVREASPADVKRLLKAAADPASVAISGGENLVFFAAARAHGARELCALLVEGRLDPTVVDTRLQQTALFFAVRGGQHAGGLDCALFLLERRCSPDHADLRGETPLFYAVQRADAACTKALVAEGASPGRANRFGQTAAFYAARAGAVAPLRFLLTARADAAARDQRGRDRRRRGRPVVAPLRREPLGLGGVTALMAAAERSADDVIRALVGRGADACAADGTGQTALSYAAQRGHMRTCKCLVEECGADPTHCDEDGTTAAEAAERSGHTALATYLRECTHASGAPPTGASRGVPGPSLRRKLAEAGFAGGQEADSPGTSSGSAEMGPPSAQSSAEGGPWPEGAGGPEERKAARRKHVIVFEDQHGNRILPGSPEHWAALCALIDRCPWLDGWERSASP
eukprot:CAMPEP_0179266874 /NCGR_PEP_ID=MMETSP0797-20121207/29638_1 /TAXON_ID=47934 /ORGANISM="Dinophysis acuminata, Strain DAEP01" /LENGTH=631 /DNA_ID=CAMNT_0020975115 /DNA_START=1 /DNA_END=1897 /DNA_ORIENTATION=+